MILLNIHCTLSRTPPENDAYDVSQARHGRDPHARRADDVDDPPLKSRRPHQRASTSPARSGRSSPTGASAATGRTRRGARPSSASTCAKARSRTARRLGDRQAGRSRQERADPADHHRRHRRHDAAAGVAPVAHRRREGAAHAGSRKGGLSAALVARPVSRHACRSRRRGSAQSDRRVRACAPRSGRSCGAARAAER